MTSIFHTHEEYDYNQLWLTTHRRYSVVFSAKACSDVHVGLARFAGINDVDMNEVVIGGWNNTKSVIRKSPQNDDDSATLETIDILSCTETRYFWISWYYGMIRVGKGSIVGDDQFLTWDGPGMVRARALSFTNAAGWSGTWHIALGSGTDILF